MSGKNLEARVRALEERVPDDIVLTLNDGSHTEHPGPALAFYMQAMGEIRRSPKARERYARVVSATGCGKLYEVLRAMALGPLEDKGGTNGNNNPRRTPAGNSGQGRRVRRTKRRTKRAVAAGAC